MIVINREKIILVSVIVIVRWTLALINTAAIEQSISKTGPAPYKHQEPCFCCFYIVDSFGI